VNLNQQSTVLTIYIDERINSYTRSRKYQLNLRWFTLLFHEF